MFSPCTFLEYLGVLGSTREYSGVFVSTPGVLFSTPNLLHEYSEVLRVLRGTSEYFGVQLLNVSKTLQKFISRQHGCVVDHWELLFLILVNELCHIGHNSNIKVERDVKFA